MGRGKGGSILVATGTNNADSDSGEIQEPTEEDEVSKGWTYHLIRNFTSVWKQDPRIHEFEADGS